MESTPKKNQLTFPPTFFLLGWSPFFNGALGGFKPGSFCVWVCHRVAGRSAKQTIFCLLVWGCLIRGVFFGWSQLFKGHHPCGVGGLCFLPTKGEKPFPALPQTNFGFGGPPKACLCGGVAFWFVGGGAFPPPTPPGPWPVLFGLVKFFLFSPPPRNLFSFFLNWGLFFFFFCWKNKPRAPKKFFCSTPTLCWGCPKKQGVPVGVVVLFFFFWGGFVFFPFCHGVLSFFFFFETFFQNGFPLCQKPPYKHPFSLPFHPPGGWGGFFPPFWCPVCKKNKKKKKKTQ